MRILIVGSGGREHALAWKIRRDRPDAELLLAPGNDGSAALGQRLPVAADDVAGLLTAARANEVELTIVGPEMALAAGIADAFSAAGLRLFGPTQAAARIEASKGWAKAFMQRHDIPTARFIECASSEEARAAIRSFATPPVIKDDALAGGKGVTVPETFEHADAAAQAIFAARPGARVVVEERLHGWELSAMAFCDGRHAVLMPPSCDYKRLLDDDRGPNTGGMGAYAPAAISDDLRRRIADEIVQPTLRGLAGEGRPFTGVLYPGLMITPDGPRVLEFNCRFGDPEAEALLPLLRSDLVDVIDACLDGHLAGLEVQWSTEACVAVVLTSSGYPDHPQPAVPSGTERLAAAVAFHGGLSGRVLTVSATGPSLAEARQHAYDAAAVIELPGGRYRTDIAKHERGHRLD